MRLQPRLQPSFRRHARTAGRVQAVMPQKVQTRSCVAEVRQRLPEAPKRPELTEAWSERVVEVGADEADGAAGGEHRGQQPDEHCAGHDGERLTALAPGERGAQRASRPERKQQRAGLGTNARADGERDGAPGDPSRVAAPGVPAAGGDGERNDCELHAQGGSDSGVPEHGMQQENPRGPETGARAQHTIAEVAGEQQRGHAAEQGESQQDAFGTLEVEPRKDSHLHHEERIARRMRLAHADIEMSDGVRQVDVVESEELAGGQRPTGGYHEQAEGGDYKPTAARETHAS